MIAVSRPLETGVRSGSGAILTMQILRRGNALPQYPEDISCTENVIEESGEIEGTVEEIATKRRQAQGCSAGASVAPERRSAPSWPTLAPSSTTKMSSC